MVHGGPQGHVRIARTKGERAARVPTLGGVAGERSWRKMLMLKYWTKGRKRVGAQIT